MSSFFTEGSCTCKNVRYRVTAQPMMTHCCHCKWCQRETGSAFVVNAMIESKYVKLLRGEPIMINTPSESGRGQPIARCPDCQIALWSHYSAGPVISFIRVGTLDTPDVFPPDVHIFTRSKQNWVTLDDHTPAFETFYNLRTFWPEDSLKRRDAIIGR